MAGDLLPWMILLGVVVFGAVVLTGWRVAKWHQPGERWYRRLRLRRRRDEPNS